MNNKKFEEKLLKKIDRVSEILETLLIIQGGIAGINKKKLRKIVGTAMNRVTEITGLIKKPKASKEKKKNKK